MSESPHISVIGLPVTEQGLLEKATVDCLLQAKWIVGSERQFQLLQRKIDNLDERSFFLLPKLALFKHWLQQRQPNEPVVVLASGDPLFYGIGQWLSATMPQVTFFPAVSSIQASCHHLGWSLQQVQVVSLHGRPLNRIKRYLLANQRLIILTDKNSTPPTLALCCQQANLLQAKIHVLEELASPQQKIRSFDVEQLLNESVTFSALHVSAIETGSLTGPMQHPSFPGIDDEQFITETDRQQRLMSKKMLRLAILNYLQLQPNEQLWDIGAGCGAVSVEAAYWHQSSQVLALECVPDRIECIEKNRIKFGVQKNLHVVHGQAPKCLSTLPTAQKVFIGGSNGQLKTILHDCWQQLQAGGCIVATAVTEESKTELLLFAYWLKKQPNTEVQSMQLAVNHASELAGQTVYRPKLPITLFKFSQLIEGHACLSE